MCGLKLDQPNVPRVWTKNELLMVPSWMIGAVTPGEICANELRRSGKGWEKKIELTALGSEIRLKVRSFSCLSKFSVFNWIMLVGWDRLGGRPVLRQASQPVPMLRPGG